MRVVRSRWFSAVLLMIAAGSTRIARADEPAGQPSPPPPTAPPSAAPPLTSVSPPATSPPPPGVPPPPVYWAPPPGYPPPGYPPPYDMRQIERREHHRAKLPKLVAHKPGMPVYDGYHLEERRPRWPLAVGLPAFGVGYVGSLVIGLAAGGIAQDEDPWAPMFIPIVGPFITLETAEKTIEFDGERVVMVAMGGFQIAGLAIAALHFVYPAKKMLVLDGKIEIRPASFAGTTGLAAHF